MVGVRWQVYFSLMRPQQWRWGYAKLVCGMDSRLIHRPGVHTHTHTHTHTHKFFLLHVRFKTTMHANSIHLASSVEVDNILLSCRELLIKCSSHRSTRYVSNQIYYYSNQIYYHSNCIDEDISGIQKSRDFCMKWRGYVNLGEL